jgi:regulatory protein
MSKITELKAGKSREKRVNVYLDEKFAINMLTDVALKEGLKVGLEITESRLKALADADSRQRCYNAATRFLAYRPRSESEIRQRLLRHGFDETMIEKTLARLKEQGLADDAAFARFWIENRETFSPRSRRLAELELKRKGLSADIIEQATGEVDDGESAYRAAQSRMRRLTTSDYQTFRRRLWQYLGRRGFSYSVIKETTEKVWKEQGKVPGQESLV